MAEGGEIRDSILTGMEDSRRTFHALVDSMDESGFKRQSLNPGWTNGEILAHVTFGFMILNSLLPLVRVMARLPGQYSQALASTLNFLTVPFNWINKLGARGQGRVFTRARIGGLFDRNINRLIGVATRVKDSEWERGMYYPTKWDSNFDRFMTVEKLLRYPIQHFNFHINQISH